MIANEITLLNETTLECLNETDEIKIVKRFTTVGLKVLGADFGFAWLNSSASKQWELVYKSPHLPFAPRTPREGGRNSIAITNSQPDFVSDTRKAPDAKYVSEHVKSFVIIPLVYKKESYGSMVFCFKTRQSFSREKKVLSAFIGNSAAQVITISRLLLLKESKRQLEEERFKLQSIADATHELRTPLAIIKGNADLALQEWKGKTLKSPLSALRAIDHETKHLATIISNLALITSKTGEFKNETVREKIEVKPFVDAVLDRCSTLAYKKNISLTASVPLKLFIWGDKMYLEKMLLNLVKNSIVYGKKNGRTAVKVFAKRGYAVFTVIDNGIGIEKEDLPHIFERFYRADKSRNREKGGTGLGLAIVKWVADLHGGSVSVKSTKNKGSIFTVTLPR